MNRSVLGFLLFALTTVLAAYLLFPIKIYGQTKAFQPDLTKLVKGEGWQIYNRNVSLMEEGTLKGVRFDRKAGVGFAWLKDYKFKTGIIEFDVRGKNILQKSFVGIAFHGDGEAAAEIVWFRPFNFTNDDPVRRSHAVQYASYPNYSWKRLRDEFPGKYESFVQPVPDPDDWFHVRVAIADKNIRVFVNNAEQPCLTVEPIKISKEGLIGLWVGEDSDGEFANLKIIPTNS